MTKLRVEIAFGGESAEHEVSLRSVKNIVDAVDKARFGVVLLGIDKQGQWHVSNANNYLPNSNDPAHITSRPSETSLAQVPGGQEHRLIDAQNGQPLPTVDIIFPIVHGTLDEGGSLQGVLRMANLPFVGSDVLGSVACMGKDVTKRLLYDAGLNIAPFITPTRANRNSISFAGVESRLGLPLFVKPADQGSSIGINKVTSGVQYDQVVALVFEFDHKVVVERGIRGREIGCAILGNNHPQANTCGEIVLNNDFYTYSTKYTDDNSAKVVIPAAVAPEINDKIREIAIQAYQTLDCAGIACVDIFLTAENDTVINGINTLPGFTNVSMYPKLWQANGLGYTDLITRLIELALERRIVDGALKTSI